MAVVEAALIAIAAAAIASTGYSVVQGEKNRTAQNEAMDRNRENMEKQEAQALKTEKLSEEATNRAYSRSPDVNSILSKAQQAGRTGASGTLLTGSQGIDPAALKLGKTSLLGGS